MRFRNLVGRFRNLVGRFRNLVGRFRNLVGIEGVIALDVLGTHNAGDDQFSHFEVDADFLLALDHHVAVG